LINISLHPLSFIDIKLSCINSMRYVLRLYLIMIEPSHHNSMFLTCFCAFIGIVKSHSVAVFMRACSAFSLSSCVVERCYLGLV
jgi:hypothetical protein